MGGKIEHITINNLSKSFFNDKKSLEVLKDISLTIYNGEFVTFFGPNGCGKSTLINILAGIESIGTGTIKYNSSEKKPEIGFVFQNYRDSLMPWLNAEQNICFPLKLRGVPKSDQVRRLKGLVEEFEIKIDLKSKVYNLSGGQAQLVSILRGLIVNPDVLMLDEPFSALDYQTNLVLYDQLLKIWEKSKVTILLISHEIDEAIFLGDRVVFFSKRPATVVDIIETNLPRPRTYSVTGTSEFASIKKRALEIFNRSTER